MADGKLTGNNNPSGIEVQPGGIPSAGETLLQRRRRVMGGLELSYDEPLHLVRGDGVWVIDAEGRRYLDAYNNVPHVGHAHPHVVAAVTRQLERFNSNTRYLDEKIVAYAERLVSLTPAGLDACLFVNSGSEAIDIAWRMAKFAGGGTGAVIIENAYHGGTDAVAAFSPYDATDRPLAPHVRTLTAPDTYRGPFGRADAEAARKYAEDADRALGDLKKSGMKPAAFIVDSGLVSHGILDAPENYLPQVAEKVRAANALVIADEVQFGFGRSGSHFWGFERHGLTPDFVTLGKPIGNGYPLGAIMTRKPILDSFLAATNYFSTFGGNPVAAAAGMAVLDVLEREGLQENARIVGTHLRDGLVALKARHPRIGDVRGAGLLAGVELIADAGTKTADRAFAKRVASDMRHEGILIGTEGPQGNVLKIRPPMPFRAEHADLLLAALGRVLAKT